MDDPESNKNDKEKQAKTSNIVSYDGFIFKSVRLRRNTTWVNKIDW